MSFPPPTDHRISASDGLIMLIRKADIRPEDRCLIGLSDCVEFVTSFFGVLKAGAVVAMVNPELPTEDYLY